MQFYEELPAMVCLAGDTLPVFTISIDTPLTGCTMVMQLEEQKIPGSVRLTKTCTLSDDSFSVQLTSMDTADLQGSHNLHFVMTDGNGLTYRKLVGTLTVHSVPKGGTA